MKERKLTRLAGFDYTSNRYYFFTVCVKDHTYTFGKIENRSMQLSGQGNIAMEQWHWLGRQYPYVDLISFVIMPDHIHGLIHIDSNYYNHRIMGMDWDTGNVPYNDVGNNNNNNVGNGRDRSLQPMKPNSKIKPLPELIGAYKTTVSKRIHQTGDVEFKWQKSYHDHIIRNIKSLTRIKHYIETNPENWVM